MPGRTIVIGVDGNSNAEKAFNWMLDNLLQKDDNVVIVHCPEIHPPLSMRDSVARSNTASKEHENVNILIAKYTEVLKKRGIAGKGVKVEGQKPGEAIIATATSNNANMIVTGTRGLGAIRRTILGSVSDYVVKHASIPVTVYRDSE